ncbi:MAG: hypothetical protein LKH27_02535 [Prevotella sp.]|jgi:hypothetical protein|nr:hypothetical protein [Prevotella sp.]MCH3991166.1 hypothetical protein [Prevotella sp.]MCH4018328.1 hypothetical protein [Prevotella sp.]MCH4100649.1 hypothetical protein [Prevotella sp.]MCI1325113.1 hypothetical protein [Prevotella sp.]MCI1350501.1 hypothetical protein [Prevotella sp.]
MKTSIPEDALKEQQEGPNPSEKTLNLIRQIAYTYHRISLNGRNVISCLN